jgi:type I restriction enzyme S subunit
MVDDWTEYSLGELTDWASGGTPRKENPEYWGGPIPWISASSMKSGRLSESDRTLTPKGLEQGSRLASKNDVLLLVRGSELHKRIPVGVAIRDVAFNQDVKALRAKGVISSAYLYYWLAGHEPMLLSKVEHTGIGAGKLDTAVLKNLRFHVPPPAEQRAIAHILGTLDDKIELNRKQNETLEAMARALFKDWFVDFGPVRAKMEGREPYLPAELWQLFPDQLDEEGKPEGWEMQPLSELLTIIGGGTPKTSVEEYWGGDIPWFSVVDTPSASDVFAVATEKAITPQGLASSSARLIPKGATIISARGTVGNLAIAGREMTFNQSCYGLRGTGSAGDYFVYLTAQQMVDQLKSMAHGSVFSTITRQTFEAIQRPVPPSRVLAVFEGLVTGWFDAVLSNVEESRITALLRDTLLPKLISGEIRVNPLPAISRENRKL